MEIRHGRVRLRLHERKDGNGTALLLLHALGAASSSWGEAGAAWNGPVYALDFCGHGDSGWLTGGAYTPEILAADADVALSHIGPAAVAGAGLGAYIALLLAGGRPEQIRAALLIPGPGLAGHGPEPDHLRGARFSFLDETPKYERSGCDPMVAFLASDVRPPDYAERFGRAARRLLFLEDGEERPPWWEAARQSPSASAVEGDLESALEILARPE
jgi:pimeloyl-ACP methyl ester carboxylesterase